MGIYCRSLILDAVDPGRANAASTIDEVGFGTDGEIWMLDLVRSDSLRDVRAVALLELLNR